jgi:hypothetical protein
MIDTGRLSDLSATTDLSQVQLVSFKKRVAFVTTLDKVLRQHGWSGALDFEECKEKLKDCLFDDDEEQVITRFAADENTVTVHPARGRPSHQTLCPPLLVTMHSKTQLVVLASLSLS